MKKIEPVASIAPIGIDKLVLLATFTSCILYHFYYLIAPWIWSQNAVYPVGKLTPWISPWIEEHDGVEIYALYILMFINIVVAFLLVRVWRSFSRQVVYYGSFVLIIMSIWYCVSVKIIPPMDSVGSGAWPFVGIAVVVLLLIVQHFPPRISAWWEIAGAFLILIPVCFIATSSISADDYSYIFMPAQRLMDGFAISDIYFQYDAFLSFLAMGWMKLGLHLWQFQVLGQLSYFAAILSVYLISRRLFHQKSLCFLLLCSLILIRIYASPWDVVREFQVTPLRLDLWLVLFVTMFFLGTFHWSIGFVCGLLIIFHRTFGIIYSIAYIQLIVTLGIINYIDNRDRARRIDVANMASYLKKVIVPLVLITVSYFIARDVFSKSAEATSYYQKIGIGFIPISRSSFFWYCPIVMSVTFVMLNMMRNRAAHKYVMLGFFLLYCTIGNSLYFFGRSHQHNILNISISLVFLFFYCLDLLDRRLNDSPVTISDGSIWRRRAIPWFGILFLASVVYAYSGNIPKKLEIQYCRAMGLPFQQEISFYERDKQCIAMLKEIKAATNDSKKVQFLGIDGYAEFLFYHYGEYKSMAFFSPADSWIFLDDLTAHMQGLIDSGYYIFMSAEMYESLFRARLLNVNRIYYMGDKSLVLISSSATSH